MLRFLLNVLSTVWLGFLAAAAVEIHRPPRPADVQGIKASLKQPATDLLERIEQAVWRRSAPLELSEADVNHYIASNLAGQQKYPSALLAKFDRVAVSFQPGLCRVWLFWTVAKHPVAAALDFTVTRDKRDFVVEPRGGSLGRLAVFRGAVSTLVPAVRSLCEALDEEIHAVFQMNQIRFEKNKVVLDPRFDPEK